jgi:O-antigen ligase
VGEKIIMMTLHWMTYLSVAVVALSSMTSVSLGALSHLLIIAPGLYFFWHAEDKFRGLTWSQWSLIGLVDAIILSVLFNWNSIGEPVGVIMKAKYFFLTVLGLYAYRNSFKVFLTPKRIRLLVTLFLVATTLATVSGLIALWTGFNPLRFKEACHETRACGVFGMYMTYGYGISLASILMLGLVLYREKLQSYLSLPLLYSATIISIIGLYFSFARGAWIGFFVALPFFFLRSHKKAFLGTIIGVVVVAALLLQFNSQVRQTFFSSDRLSSNSNRLSMYQAAWIGFKESPIVGLGFRQFEPHSKRIKTENNLGFTDFAGHAHNNFLEHLASTGLLGFLALLFFHIFWFIEMLKRKDVVGDIVLPFIVVFSVSGLFQYNVGDAENLFMIMMVYALSQIHWRSDDSLHS